MTTDESPCVRALRALLVEGRIDVTLPPGCRRADVEQALGGRGEEGLGELSGRSRTQVKYPLDDRQVRVFYEADGGVLLADVEGPRVTSDLEALLARLGAPEATLPARKGVMGYVGEEQVFARHGCTLVIGTPLEGTAGGRKLLRLIAYAPTEVKDYEERLGGKDPWIIRRPAR